MSIATTVKSAIDADTEHLWSVKYANETGHEGFCIDSYHEVNPEYRDVFMIDDCINYGVRSALAMMEQL